ncbi:methylmercaptopropionate CoA ligase [Cribrihabitans marinus]|uniref:3-methylmercaptopropionyl-CoA ligase n=1 Tax=Cribrihabitans marinus TaxID=1227549 RepID=A0A1H6W3Z6_9RHOB|nr:long-chain-fatty-acid--CoA ligase [Cribrihabitans marinus]GGH25067.1 long-chain-fatty-acid--CoA ligase [Cribrihabitans marinus]SEJ08767.1 methylmercaptopropionate CoA ligase [Cribrihabitans marinus]
MLGQMMAQPLLISSLIRHAAQYHGQTGLWSVETDGSTTETTWGGVAANSARVASALTALDLPPQARIATIAWNNRRHLELYFGVSGAGFVLHTVNPRLFPEQLVYILNHAEDRVLFIDATFVPLVAALRDQFETVEHVVLMGPADTEAAAQIPGLKSYDDLISGGDPGFDWPEFDENTASSLCYTSGTTGNPKGVLYSHRTTLLHSFASNTRDVIGYSARDVVLPVVPMFHVNAWGSPYACAMAGAQMVLPGPDLSGAALTGLIGRYEVTLAMGVPTIWQGLLHHARSAEVRLDSLQRTVIGGSACPPSMIAEFRDRHGVETIHAWGMTEMSPLGTTNTPLAKHAALDEEARHRLRESQGRPPFGVEMKIVGDDGAELPADGATQGDLLVRGLWVLDSYFHRQDEEMLRDGWFPTGDVATLDPDGYMTIRDRSKDIIKSGGEWISSVELENIAVGHPQLADAAVVGVPHRKWDERPVLVAVPEDGETPAEAELLAFFEDRIAHWQIPDRVVFIDTLPRNATGKVLKRSLREQFRDLLQPAG